MRNHEKKYEYGIIENSYESPKELKSKIQRKDIKKKKHKTFHSQPRAMGSTPAKLKTCDLTILHTSQALSLSQM